MKFFLAAILVAAVSGSAHAGFYENTGVTDREASPVVPSGFRVSDVTQSCVAYLKDQGYIFSDRAEIDRMAEEAKAQRIAEIRPPAPIMQERIVYVDQPPSAALRSCTTRPAAATKVHKPRKRAKKAVQHKICS